MVRQNNTTAQKKSCHFCVNNMLKIDYKAEEMLRKFLSSYGKIVPRRRSGVCMKHQRKLAAAIKRARVVGILPFSIR